jgi:hypothetical protein
MDGCGETWARACVERICRKDVHIAERRWPNGGSGESKKKGTETTGRIQGIAM